MGGAAQDVERYRAVIQRPLGGQTCRFWTLYHLGPIGRALSSGSWPPAQSIPAVRGQAGERMGELDSIPHQLPQDMASTVPPCSQGPPWPCPHLPSSRKREVGLRILALLECCPNPGLGLFGPAAPFCSQGPAGACWPPQHPELAD